MNPCAKARPTSTPSTGCSTPVRPTDRPNRRAESTTYFWMRTRDVGHDCIVTFGRERKRSESSRWARTESIARFVWVEQRMKEPHGQCRPCGRLSRVLRGYRTLT